MCWIYIRQRNRTKVLITSCVKYYRTHHVILTFFIPVEEERHNYLQYDIVDVEHSDPVAVLSVQAVMSGVKLSGGLRMGWFTLRQRLHRKPEVVKSFTHNPNVNTCKIPHNMQPDTTFQL